MAGISGDCFPGVPTESKNPLTKLRYGFAWLRYPPHHGEDEIERGAAASTSLRLVPLPRKRERIPDCGYCKYGRRRKAVRSALLTRTQVSRPSRTMRMGMSAPALPMSQTFR